MARAGPGNPSGLYLTRSDSPESRPFDFPLADILAISSSGEMAILLGNAPTGVLARAPLTGGAPREVLEGVLYAGADWAPDGKDLVIAHQVANRARLEYPIGKVILESREEDFSCPRFSPAGDQIAFYQADSSGNASLAVVKTSGKERRTLWNQFGEITGVPCWRPDGREIWITTAPPGLSPALYAVDLAGKRRLVARAPGTLELDDISRDGRVLAAHHTTVQILNGLVAGEEKERDLSWLDGSVPADLSADGKTLVFTETAEGSGGRPAVYLRRTDGSPALRLGEGAAIALSPDGKTVLASVRSADGKEQHLVLLPTGAGETRTLKNDGLESFGGGGGWLPDGRRIVFMASEKGHGPRIYIQDIEKGAARPITPERTGSGPRRIQSRRMGSSSSECTGPGRLRSTLSREEKRCPSRAWKRGMSPSNGAPMGAPSTSVSAERSPTRSGCSIPRAGPVAPGATSRRPSR